MTDWFTFQARLDRVVDGDTVDLICDLGFRARHETRVRLSGVDTAEIYGVSRDSEEYRLGQEQAEFVYDWFHEHRKALYGLEEWPFVLESEKETGKYGRWIGVIRSKAEGPTLNEALVEAYPEVADD